MKKFASILLSTALAALAPGLAPYEALAGVTVRSAGTVRSGGVNAKSPSVAGTGVSVSAVQAIAPGAVVSNLTVVDSAITLTAPIVNVANPAAIPTLSVPRRSANITPTTAIKPSATKSGGPTSRGPPVALKSLKGFVPAAINVGGKNKKKDGKSADAPSAQYSLASAASLQSLRFDGAALRKPGITDGGIVATRGSRWVHRPNLLRANAADSAPKADIEILFADEFIDAARERSHLNGKDRWAKNEWDRLKGDVQSFVNGAGSSAVGTKRGKAVQVGVFKFKWGNQGLRIFARLDPTGTQLTILDLKGKEDLLSGGEAAYYEELAERVDAGEITAFGTDALPKLGRSAFERLKLPGTAITARFKKAKTIYGWRNDVRNSESQELLDEARNNADDGAGFDPLQEISADAIESGVYEPQLDGTLDVSQYSVPFGIRAKRAAFLGIHYAGVVAFASFLTLSLGWIPVSIGFGAAGVFTLAHRVSNNMNPASSSFVPEGTTEGDLLDVREDLVRLQRGDSLAEDELADLDSRVAPLHAFMDWAEGATQVLVNRAGFDGYRAPRLWFNESHSDPYAAHSSLGDLDRGSSFYIGVGFLLRPLGETLAMMGHEMGHLFHGDYGFFRENFRLNPGGAGFRRGLSWATGVASVSAIAATLIYAAHSFLQGALIGIDPVSAAVSIGWIAAAFLSAVLGLFAGFAATRQDELRADNFGAWITHPQWWISWLRMRKASRDLSDAQMPEERTALGRIWDRLMSTHPDYDERIRVLDSFNSQGVARDIPTLPSSDSVYGLNGETTIVLSGLDAGALEAFQANLEGPFEAQVYFIEQEGEATGSTLVRVHRTDRPQLDGKVDRDAVSAIKSAATKAYAEAKVVSASSKPHEVFRWAAKSRTARTVLRTLKKIGVPIRWDTTLGAEDARGIFRADGENGPEILVNPTIFLKASPKALLALIAHEAYHAGVWAKMRDLGIDWLNLGGLEFERLAHSIGFRVFTELGGTEIDDIGDAKGEPAYGNAIQEWKTLDEDAHIDYLKKHGYDSFVRLRDLRALSPRDLAAEIGSQEDPATIAGQVEALWKFYETERKGESRWHFWSILR